MKFSLLVVFVLSMASVSFAKSFAAASKKVNCTGWLYISANQVMIAAEIKATVEADDSTTPPKGTLTVTDKNGKNPLSSDLTMNEADQSLQFALKDPSSGGTFAGSMYGAKDMETGNDSHALIKGKVSENGNSGDLYGFLNCEL